MRILCPDLSGRAAAHLEGINRIKGASRVRVCARSLAHVSNPKTRRAARWRVRLQLARLNGFLSRAMG